MVSVSVSSKLFVSVFITWFLLTVNIEIIVTALFFGMLPLTLESQNIFQPSVIVIATTQIWSDLFHKLVSIKSARYSAYDIPQWFFVGSRLFLSFIAPRNFIRLAIKIAG